MSGQLSTNIAQARASRGLTQAQVADAVGVSRPTYIKIETGKKEPTLSQAELLTTALGISLDDLLSRDGASATPSDVIAATEKYKQIISNAIRFGADSDGRITKTKLAKLVYLIDFINYYETERSMSHMTYRKLPHGPVSNVYFRALDEMEDAGAIAREARGQAIMFSLTERDEAPRSRLSDQELSLIKRICQAWRGRSTSEIVEFTHGQTPWQTCYSGEAIPYSLIFQEEPEKIYGPATAAV